MQEQFLRTEMLFGANGMKRLSEARVALFGVGGVGGYTAEALARSGVGKIMLVDNDKICTSNINRQIVATTKTVGRYKVDVMRERILEINPEAVVQVCRCFYLPDNAAEFDLAEYDYVVDAVDTVTAKIELVVQAQRVGTPIISCMGAGNKLDAAKFEVADVYQTSVCPLAKVMRKELKRRGIAALKVVYSQETPRTPVNIQSGEDITGRRATPGSNAFVPSVAGLIIAGEVVRDLSGHKR